MAKSVCQRSVYIPTDEWEQAREIAWRRRMSVSGLICALLHKESLEFKAPPDPDFVEVDLAPKPPKKAKKGETP